VTDEQTEPRDKYPAALLLRTLADLEVGESATAFCTSMIVLPGGTTYVDQYEEITSGRSADISSPPYITVTRLSETTCRVDLSRVGKFRTTAKPVMFSNYPYQCWLVKEFTGVE
jgi:hypothetical protein